MVGLSRLFSFKQKAAYEWRISDWSSDVCSSDLIADLTCDSDGKIDTYVENEGLDSSLPLHAVPADGGQYRPAFLLLGAYQELLGDIHDRKSVVLGKRRSGRVDYGGGRSIKKKKKRCQYEHMSGS